MRITIEEAEQRIPRLNRTVFAQEKCAREIESLSVAAPMDMLELKNGWRIIGWAKSADVAPRHQCAYVCMFRKDNGFEAWCHVATTNFRGIAERLKREL